MVTVLLKRDYLKAYENSMEVPVYARLTVPLVQVNGLP